MKKQFLTTIIALNFATTSAFSAISITLNYTDIGEGGVNNSGISAAQQTAFTAAKATWETYLTGYREDAGITEIVINVSGPAIDGPGMVLGSAGPDSVANSANFTYSTSGEMRFDSADIQELENDGELESVVFHEMGHVLGSGTLWEDNGLYIDGSFEFTGETALEKYQRDFDPTATFVPVEDEGGPGTAGAHWDEDPGNPRANNPNAPYNGNSFNAEVMTGFSSGADNFLSDVTIGAFYDLGYTVEYIVPGGPFHWDAGNPTNDGAITSGDGIWNLTNTNFAIPDGTENKPYEDRSIVIFGDTGSTVTLEGTLKPFSISVEADGYTFINGTLDTGEGAGLILNVVDAAHTLDLNSPVVGASSLIIGGAGTVNNLNTISSEIEMNSGTLLNNGTGVISGNITLANAATLRTDAGGLDNGINVNNGGTLDISADQSIQNYTSTGTLSGAGSLTADSFALNGGSVVNSDLLNGDITTNGAVSITSATAGNLNVASGTTTLTGSNAGNVNILAAGQLNSAANTLSDTAAVVNAGVLNLQGDETIASYDGRNGTLRGSGALTLGSFRAGIIETAVNGTESLGLTVDNGGAAVTLGAGSTLKFDTAAGPVNLLDVFPLFTNTSGIVGDATSIGFENFDLSALGFDVRAVFDVTTGNIIITSSSFSGNTPNSSAVAAALYGVEAGAGRITNVNGISGESQDVLDRLNALATASATDDVTIQSQLQELSPEVYGSVADYSLRQHLSYKDAATHAQYTVRNGTWEVFAGVNSQTIKSDSSLDNADYELQGSGGYVGISQQNSNVFRYGMFLATDDGEIKSNNGLLNLDASGNVFGAFTELGVLMPWENDQKHGLITAGISFGKFDYSGTRSAQLITNTTGDFSASTFEIGLGYKVALIDNPYFKMSPYLGFDYIVADVDGFSETNPGPVNNALTVSDYSKKLLLFNYGVESEWRPTAGSFGFTAKLGMQQNLADDSSEITANFTGAPDFTVTSPGLSEAIMEARGGIFFNLTENSQLRASYFKLSGDDIDSASGGNIGFSVAW